MHWFRSFYFIWPILAALAGCVAIPEQLQIISLTPEGGTQIAAGTCKVDSEQTAKQVKNELHNNIQALNSDGFAVLNWNVYKGNRDNWQDDLIQFSAQQDIVLLQEALLTDELKSSLAMHGLKWNLNAAFYYGDQQTGVMTAAKVDSSFHCALRAMEPIIRTPKTALINRYALAGIPQQLIVANVHGINFALGLDAYRKQLDEVEEILSRHYGPMILAGDFNNWSDGRTRLLTEMVERLSLQQLPYENHNRTMVFGSAIDHIFYRGLLVARHETHKVTSSDHNPITVTFRAAKTRIARNLQ